MRGHVEHIFYQLRQAPILFTYLTDENVRLLCSCCQMDQEWILCQPESQDLIQMMDDGITIRSVFEKNERTLQGASWDGKKFETTTPDPGWLPKEGAYLELHDERTIKFKALLTAGQEDARHGS